MPEISSQSSLKRTLFIVLLLIVTYSLILTALVVPLIAPFSTSPLQVGLVAPQDLRAPRSFTFQSNLLTAEQRDTVASLVQPVYTSPDTTIARNQLEKLRSTIAFISSVRVDEYSTNEQKMSDLAALEYIQMNEELSRNLLDLGETRWQAVQQEAISVLEQVMRSTIREDRLEDVRINLPAMVSLSLTTEQASIVAKLVEAFIAPNSFYSEGLTESARQKARQAVTPVTRSYQAAETIVQRGSVLTPTDMEALAAAGLVQPEYNWKEFVSAAVLALLALIVISLYLNRIPAIVRDTRTLLLMSSMFLVFLLASRILIPGHTLIPYAFPHAAYAMTVAVLIGTEPAIITSIILSILSAFGLPAALELTLFYAFGSVFGILILGRATRVMSFLLAGAAVAISGTFVSFLLRLPEPTTDLVGLASIAGASTLNGLASAGLSILLQFFLAQLLGLTTVLQLLEISRPDHPLLQYLLRQAPGTYQHSLQVANLAEQAAEIIGGDTLLTRVGALYHDIGKAKKPIFYIENQVPNNVNPHDDLGPETSAQFVISHVMDGVEQARKYRLPKRIQDFILEHHGTMIARYQYANALKAAGGDEGKIDKEKFRYPGPPPSSKESAILMLADGCEARVRAERPKDETELKKIIKSVIDDRLAQGQLDKTNLTVKDLTDLVESFTATLRGMYHPRLEYPKLEKSETGSDNIPSSVPILTNHLSDSPPKTEIEIDKS